MSRLLKLAAAAIVLLAGGALAQSAIDPYSPQPGVPASGPPPRPVIVIQQEQPRGLLQNERPVEAPPGPPRSLLK
jgi:hypothetical protein